MRFILSFVLLIFVCNCHKKEEVTPANTMSTESNNSSSTSSLTGIATVTSVNTTTSSTVGVNTDSLSTAPVAVQDSVKSDTSSTVLSDTTDSPVSTNDSVLTTTKNISIIALGDSYTKGESVLSNQKYPVQLVDSLKRAGYKLNDPKVIATTGWTTDELMNGIKLAADTNTYDFAFLLIGVNNQYRGRTVSTYTPDFEALLTTALGYVKNNPKHVFVISIPDYGYTPVGASNKTQISAGIDAYNAENKRISELAGVNYIEITDISRGSEAGLVAYDGLHPSAYQYKKWVDRIIPVITPYLP